MVSATYSRIGAQGGGVATYAVSISGKIVACIERTGQRWQLRYAACTLTLSSLPAATQLVERFADKIAAGHPVDGSAFEVTID